MRRASFSLSHYKTVETPMLYLQSSSLVCRYKRLRVGFVFLSLYRSAVTPTLGEDEKNKTKCVVPLK